MFVHRSTLLPAPGRLGDVRKLVEEATRARQAQGVAASATALVYGPNDRAGAVHMLMRYPDLDSLEKHRDSLATETGVPGTSDFGAAVSPLLREHLHGALAEVVLPAPPSSVTARWFIRTEAIPQTDKVAQTGRATIRFAEVQQKLGLRTSVARSRAGTTIFITNRAHASLGELEESWRTLADPEATAVLSELVSTLAAPLLIELQQVIVPLPS